MSAASSSNNYVFLYMDPGYYARFDKNDRQLETYDTKANEWNRVTNTSLVRRLNQDAEQITFAQFQEYIGGNTAK